MKNQSFRTKMKKKHYVNFLVKVCCEKMAGVGNAIVGFMENCETRLFVMKLLFIFFMNLQTYVF